MASHTTAQSNKRPRVSFGPDGRPLSTSWPGRDRAPSVDAAERRHVPKAKKACINCRSQKMRCVPSDDDPRTCRRCQRTAVPCTFVPRANAAVLPSQPLMPSMSPPTATGSLDGPFKSDVLRRLRAVEEYLGLGSLSTAATAGPVDAAPPVEGAEGHDAAANGVDSDMDDEDVSDLPPTYASLGALWQAVGVLRATAPASTPRRLWTKRTVGALWLAFHDRMPGLHFMPRKQIFSVPQPLLLASILFCSSVRGPAETAADLAPHYYAVLCNAIAQLSIPDSTMGRPHPPTDGGLAGATDADEEWAFQTVLGIVLAGLLTEASNRVVGLWISVAHRLILEHCPSSLADGEGPGGGGGGDDDRREWRKLFSGVQIIDLEHASLHLSCPVIPIESPLPALHVGYRDPLYRLSRMMHTGLTHFTGRGLPTIWSVFTSDAGASTRSTGGASTPPFTAIDAAVIRDWARQLDDWLVEFSRSTPQLATLVAASTSTSTGTNTTADTRTSTTDTSAVTEHRRLVFRQYVLHRLVVLSIYHPARGCDLWSNSITPQEQHELLLSARATLKLYQHDDSIWSNWDLVMITWAALIVLQGVEGGVGEVDDLQNIQVHLTMLKQFYEPKSPMCGRLIARLEASLQGVHTPVAPGPQQQYNNAQQPPPNQSQFQAPQPSFLDRTSSGLGYQSWHIFDQASLEHIGYPEWSILRQ
ncbi:uncharacterized protein SPSK_08720 [Sporothrix schenckii 1099-18]|uniref:Zn(2)-C6 fungal-type domain-containing protein n=2 Tax=Sporothrix schenckii TaxID=29908 RepID=U7PXX6_SPOS1|nr:uncharacterized protein SPSK_08720 [Sporothrix schenckii 1099-18]ERT00489.1 hypothetical protein HMPREF1624_03862 [Sporothrix schenckii ATCC 58251]KJR85014.1 hypothetical protein SPSK_08720 [Sporothrix schenckii 1099-18]